VNFATARYWDITLLQVKPGGESEFEDLAKEYVELHKKGNVDVKWAVYQVQYGPSSPAYLYIGPLGSLAELDVDREATYKELFTPGVTRRFDSVSRDSIARWETMLIQVRPEISHPPQTIVAANPDFWTVKEAVATTAPAKSKGKKKAPVEPAALKEKEQPK